MKISTDIFITMSKLHIIEYINKYLFIECDNMDDIWQVWYAKTLQNHKGIFAIPSYLFECTYNGDKGELYIDCYEKRHHEVIEVAH